VNKSDLAETRAADLRRRVDELQETGAFRNVLVASAATGEGCEEVLAALEPFAAEGPHYFPDDSFTDMPERYLVAEILREKLLLNLREEIPHGTAVEIERFHERKSGQIIDIDATIYCEKKSHKGLIIGKEGAMLKKIASEARAECEDLLQSKVNLQCWVKVQNDWRDDENFIRRVGLDSRAGNTHKK
jgi:GTP-binding protein Era